MFMVTKNVSIAKNPISLTRKECLASQPKQNHINKDATHSLKPRFFKLRLCLTPSSIFFDVVPIKFPITTPN